MTHNLDAFLEDLSAEVELLRGDYPLPVMAFTAYVTDAIAPLTNVDEHIVVHCLKRVREGLVGGEIHGYGISRDEKVLTLYYSIYSDTPRNSTSLLRSDIDRAVNRLQGFYNQAIRGAHMDVSEYTSEYEALKYIYDHLAHIMTVRLSVLSNYSINDCSMRDIRIDGKEVVLDIWDIKKIYAHMQSGSHRREINVDFEDEFKDFKLPYIEVCPNNSEYKYISTVFSAKLLYRLYERYSTDLLFGNLRQFLKFRGRKDANANINIRETLRHESENMLAYNNGIVAIAQGFEGKDISGYIAMDRGSDTITDDIASTGIISRLLDFRIVNGGQTTACLFDAKYHDKSINLNSVFIPVKIIIPQQANSKLVYDIIKNSHVQNPIKRVDYNRGSQFDLKLEELSRSTMVPNKDCKPLYWYYERLRLQYQNERDSKKARTEQLYFESAYPRNNKFSKEELAKVWICWYQHPTKATIGLSTTTSFYLEEVVGAEFVPDTTYFKNSISLLIIYRYLKSRPEMVEYRNGKVPVIAYSIAYLSMFTNGNLDLDKIWKEQDLSDELKSFLGCLCDAIWRQLKAGADAVDRTVLSYSKRNDVYDTIKMTDFGLSIESIKNDLIERGW